MGVLNYLQKFLPNCHLLTKQFRPSLKMSNKQIFVWGADQQKGFEDTLNLLSNITKMYQKDQKRNSRVKCDAGHSGLGSALEQELPDGPRVPISIASRFLKIQEKKYSTNKLELLAIVWSYPKLLVISKTFYWGGFNRP